MSLSVVFTPEAEDQLVELYRYVAAAGSAEVASRYTEEIVAFCEELASFPHRGRARHDIRSGLRTIGFRRRVVIAYAVLGQNVVVIGVFYVGRQFATGGLPYDRHVEQLRCAASYRDLFAGVEFQNTSHNEIPHFS